MGDARDLGDGDTLVVFVLLESNMAASGINEHAEACRKQNFINRQTFHKQQLEEKCAGKLEPCEHYGKNQTTPGHLGPLSSYDLEKLHKKHGASDIDQERRNAIKQQQYLTYTAKINGRLSSTNYVQQW